MFSILVAKETSNYTFFILALIKLFQILIQMNTPLYKFMFYGLSTFLLEFNINVFSSLDAKIVLSIWEDIGKADTPV